MCSSIHVFFCPPFHNAALSFPRCPHVVVIDRYPVTNCNLVLHGFAVNSPQKSPMEQPAGDEAAGAEAEVDAGDAAKGASADASPAVLRSAAAKAVRSALQQARDKGECYLVEPFMAMQVGLLFVVFRVVVFWKLSFSGPSQLSFHFLHLTTKQESYSPPSPRPSRKGSYFLRD